MIRHVVMFSWADDVDEAHVGRVSEALDALPGEIREIVRYAHGSDLALADGNHDYAIIGYFESVDDYVAYRDHPVHRAFIADLIAGRVTERAAVQFEC
jgi:hypothetical protein